MNNLLLNGMVKFLGFVLAGWVSRTDVLGKGWWVCIITYVMYH